MYKYIYTLNRAEAFPALRNRAPDKLCFIPARFGAGSGAHQVVQHPHERLELVLAQAALVQRPEGGPGAAHGAQPLRAALLLRAPLQHDQVLRAARARQRRHLRGTGHCWAGTARDRPAGTPGAGTWWGRG